MKINLIGESFDINSGQGIYKYSGEILKELKKTNNQIFTNKKGDINHVQQPELIWKALFKKNVITTFHDIMPFFINERKKSFNLFFRASCWVAMKKSKKIISVSKNTKKDILKYLKANSSKIEVIYEGVSKEFFPMRKKKKEKIIIGYIGGLGKRKNVEFILELAKELREIEFRIGGKGPDKERLKNISKKMNLNNVKFVGFIPDKKMNKFYNSLDLFIFPSLYEGFGLPIVEAMACGLSCLISDRGSLPEIAGNAGGILNVNDLENSKEKIMRLIKDKKEKISLSKKAIKRAKEFRWDKTARETLKVYEGVLK